MKLVALVLAIAASAGCKKHEGEDEDEESDEAGEKADEARVYFWRAQVKIVGQGKVTTADGVMDCASDGVTQRGECGPKVWKFHELKAPVLKATGAPGWEWVRWDLAIREPTGLVHPRLGPQPDGRLYLDSFGEAQTEQTELVTVTFARARDGKDDAWRDQKAATR